jgi:uncharacterized protein YycO
MYFGTKQERGWIGTILVPAALVVAAALGINQMKVQSKTNQAPTIVYENHWSGEIMSPEDLQGAAWAVTKIERSYDLRGADELQHFVEVSRFKWTPGETTLYVEEWGYDFEEFGHQIDEGNLF